MGMALSNAILLCSEHHHEIRPADLQRFMARRARERLTALHQAGAAAAKLAAIHARDRGEENAAQAARKLRRQHLRELARLTLPKGALTDWT